MTNSTLVRVPRDIVDEWNRRWPGLKKPKIIRTIWDVYKDIDQAGKFLYGKMWK